MRIWAVGDTRAGVASQVVGLAEAVGGNIRFVHARLKPPFAPLPARALALAGELGLSAFETEPALEDPLPDLFIGAGRAALAVSLALRRAGVRTLRVQLQDPRIAPTSFDLVIPPLHDRLVGENVFPILGAPHRVSASRLEAESLRWQERLGHLPSPRVAVLIGGRSRAYRLPTERLEAIARDLAELRDTGASLMVTVSRRTGPDSVALLKAVLGPSVFFWDGTGENPLFGMLAHAEHVLVTEDSTNMITEAAATGAPVHLIPLAGGSAKFRRFHEELIARGIARRFRGTLERWSYEPLRETERAAAEIRRRLAARTA